jgi:hypothetical protein
LFRHILPALILLLKSLFRPETINLVRSAAELVDLIFEAIHILFVSQKGKDWDVFMNNLH